MKGLRVLELSKALEADYSDILAICAILNLNATSRLSIAQIARMSEESASRAFANSSTLKPFKILKNQYLY